MKNRVYTAIIISFLAVSLHAQNTLYKEVNVTVNDVQMTSYVKDPGAEAVVFFDIGKIYFVCRDNKFEVHYERKSRIKIFSEPGFRWGEIEIPYYRKGDAGESIVEILATTYNIENGELVSTAFKSEDSFDEAIDNYRTIRKFALPGIKTGSVIEYRYHIISYYNYNLRDWEFQWDIPVIYSELDINIPPFFEYTFALQGSKNFDINNSFVEGVPKRYSSFEYNDMVHQLVMKDIPAFIEEDFTCSSNDYKVKIIFQLFKVFFPDLSSLSIITNWPDLVKEILNDPFFGNNIDGGKSLANKILNMDSIIMLKPLERFNAIVSHVKENFNWNGHYSKFASKSARALLTEKYGNSADINLFLTGLLRAAKLEAYPVVISTREHGKIRTDQPLQNLFNYVITEVEIDGKKILTDATEVMCRNDRLPVRCINDKGLILKRGDTEWVSLEFTGVSEEKTDIFYLMSDDNSSYVAQVKVSATEYEGLELRNKFGNDPEKIGDYLAGKKYKVADTSIHVQNYHTPDLPYVLSYETTGRIEFIKEKIYLSPFLNETISSNPFKEKERKYPVDLVYARQKEFNATFNIPAGYSLETVPENYSIIKEDYVLIYDVITDGSRVSVSLRYALKKSVYNSTEYHSLKLFFNMVISKAAQKIVFAKE